MRIITCASYFGTGSSAVTDFVSEYKGVCAPGKFEYRFIQDPDGISDLEYNIVENNHRHNTSYAIKRFLTFTKKLNSFGTGWGYREIDKEFQALTLQYIEDITELYCKSWWHRDRIDRGEFFCFIDRIYSFIRRIFSGGLNTERKYSLLKNYQMAYFSAIGEKAFLEATRAYIDKAVGLFNANNQPFVMIDQLLPPTNIDRYLRYFNDIKVVVVDRDPRDVYIYEKERYRWGVVPTATVEDYVKWYKITRKYSHPTKEDTERIIRIRFEDLIYCYEDTSKKIEEFLGLTDKEHVRKRNKFNPDISIKNTNLKETYKNYQEEVSYIEKELRDYLYEF